MLWAIGQLLMQKLSEAVLFMFLGLISDEYDILTNDMGRSSGKGSPLEKMIL